MPLVKNSCPRLQCQQSPMKADAQEFMIRFKAALVEEIKAQRCDDNDDDRLLTSNIKNYFKMFDGLLEKSIRCSVCKGITKEQTSFEELLLHFDQKHHDENRKQNKCDLGSLLKDFYSSFNSNSERECEACQQKTGTSEKNFIVRYPQILRIVISRYFFKMGIDEDRILSSVNFPLENFQPSKYLGANDDKDDTTYDLIASVNFWRKPNGEGHYTAVCRKDICGQWYNYDDEEVTVANFTRRNGLGEVKVEYRRAATILFYLKRGKPTSSDDDCINSTTEDSVEIVEDCNNPEQNRINEVSIPVISESKELHHVIISIHSRH